MNAFEHERLMQVVAVRMRKQPRPEVVVLALEEGWVVAEAVRVESLAVDENRRMKERRAEQGVPTQRPRSAREHVGAPPPTALVEIDDGRADDRRARVEAKPLHLQTQAIRLGDVVSVESSHVFATSAFEAPVERGGEAGLLLVPQDHETPVVDGGEYRRRVVRRCVVDHEQLEIVERLGQHAVDCFRQEARVVVDGQQDGDERHGR